MQPPNKFPVQSIFSFTLILINFPSIIKMCKPENSPRMDFALPRYICHATLFFYTVPSYALMDFMPRCLQATWGQSAFLIGLSNHHICSTLSVLNKVNLYTWGHHPRSRDRKLEICKYSLHCTVPICTNFSHHDLISNTSTSTVELSVTTVLTVSNCIS